MAGGNGIACAEQQRIEGRDGRRRFAKGNKGGAGNPYARKMASLKKALMDDVQPTDIVDVAIILLLKARQGDHAVVKLLFSYVPGLPKDQVDPDRLDQDEWQIWMQSILSERDLGKLDLGMPIDRVNELATQRMAEQRRTFDGLYCPMANGDNGQEVPSRNGGDGQGAPSSNGSDGGYRAGEPTTNGSNGEPGRRNDPTANGRDGEERQASPMRNGSVGQKVHRSPMENGCGGAQRAPRGNGTNGGRSAEEYCLLVEEGLWQSGTMNAHDDPERIGAWVLADAMKDLEAPLANGLTEQVFLHALDLIGQYNAGLKQEYLQGAEPRANGANGEQEYRCALQRLRLVGEAVWRIYHVCKGRSLVTG